MTNYSIGLPTAIGMLLNPESQVPQQWVELRWIVMGDRIPADHGYRLYSALIGLNPALKDADWHLATITGIPER